MKKLNVPYSEKSEAKALGAVWHVDQRTWYVPPGVDPTPLARWAMGAQADKASVLPRAPEYSQVQGQSGSTKKRSLFVDLVPSTAWYSNLRSELSTSEWESVKKATYKAADYICEECSGQGPAHPVECHERWDFDLVNRVQTLIGTVALCPDCHEVTHFGLAKVRGRGHVAKNHLMKVNDWTDAQATQHIREAGDLWKLRSALQWKLDARWLLSFVPMSEPTTKKIQAHAAGLAVRDVSPGQQATISMHTPRGRPRI